MISFCRLSCLISSYQIVCIFSGNRNLSFVDGEAEFGESPDAAVVRIIQEQTGLTSVVDRILYTWTFMIGSECNLGLSYLCLTDMDEDTVVLSEDLNNAKWIEADEIEDYINNRRMIEDLKNAELY